MNCELILASASPRRRELLAGLGFDFRVQPAHIDETPASGEEARAHVERLAQEKAQAVASVNAHAVVLAADTIVVLDGRILGKPSSDAEAFAMLCSLSGRQHQVMTAIAVHAQDQKKSLVQVSDVRFRALRKVEVAAYVNGGEPQDKAGAYGIQGGAARFVEHLSGSYTGVMGLPLCQTEQLLREIGCERPPS